MSEKYLAFNENVLLQTVVSVDHPHPQIMRFFHLVRGKCLDVTTVQAAPVHLTRLLGKLDYTAAVVNIIMWNYMQNIFYTLLACTATTFVVKKYSTH
jgi:hypothetical protein